MADDAMLERFLDGDMPSASELEHTLAVGVAAATVFPVVCGSAATAVAIDRLADFICEIGPSPADRPGVEVIAAGSEQQIAADANGQPLAFVFKTIADPYVGQLSLFKVLSGTVKPDDHLVNPRTGADERLHALFAMRGKEQDPVTSVPAGDIAAVAKLSATATGDTLAPKGTPVRVPAIEPPPPVLALAIKARTQADEDKLGSALARLQEEDPGFVLERNDETKQTLLARHRRDAPHDRTRAPASEVRRRRRHRRGAASPTARRSLSKPRLRASTRSSRAVTASSASRGCGLSRCLAARASSTSTRSSAVRSPVSSSPPCRRASRRRWRRAASTAIPVVDVKVTCFDGKYHSVDSSEMSFKMAGSLGFKEAMAKAGAVVLEPVSLLKVTVPAVYQGDVMGDINARRGRVQGTDAVGGGEQEVTALVPTSEIMRYAIDLRSMTGGRGRFTATHSHYDPMPSHLVDKVAKPKAEAH